MTGIAHALWIFDLTSTAHLTCNQVQTITRTLSILNDLYLANCTNASIDSAKAVATTAGSISPGLFDAVVFLVPDTNDSIIAKIGQSIDQVINDPQKVGLTVTGMVDGGVAEVYWNRLVNDDEVAASIFHEAAHLKSDGDPAMHTFHSPGMGGAGVRVLAARNYQFQSPSFDDLIFYSDHIPKQIKLRTRVPP
jgi:hypothetical protein